MSSRKLLRDSPSMRMALARMPCLIALPEQMRLPDGVFGPVDFCALARLAARRLSEICI